jgi:hypothetical protein
MDNFELDSLLAPLVPCTTAGTWNGFNLTFGGGSG